MPNIYNPDVNVPKLLSLFHVGVYFKEQIKIEKKRETQNAQAKSLRSIHQLSTRLVNIYLIAFDRFNSKHY